MATSYISVINLILLTTVIVLNHSTRHSLAVINNVLEPGSDIQTITESGGTTTPSGEITTSGQDSTSSSGQISQFDEYGDLLTEGTVNESFTGNDFPNSTTPSSMNQYDGNSTIPGFEIPDDDMLNLYFQLHGYGTYVTSFPGVVGNTLALIVLLNMNEHTNTKVYMVSLSITDLVLCVWRIFIISSSMLNYYDIAHSWFCIFLFFPTNFCYVFSNFIVCCWTTERFIAVVFPLKMNAWCTSRNTKFALFIAFLLAFGLDSVYFSEVITFSVPRNAEQTEWRRYCDYTEFIYQVWNWIDFSYYIIIPSAIVASLNSAICYKMYHLRKNHKKLTTNSDAVERRSQEQRQMTITLIVIAISFVFFHTPYMIYLIYEALVGYFFLTTESSDVVQYLGIVTMKLCDLQNCVNFLLYMISGRKFRAKFFSLFCRCGKKPGKTEKTLVAESAKGIYSVSNETGSTAVLQQ